MGQITYTDKSTGQTFSAAEANEIKASVNDNNDRVTAQSINKAASAALGTTVNFATGIFQPKTHSGSIEIATISNPFLGTIALTIVGGTDVTIATGLIAAERIRGAFNPAKGTNVLKITCYDATTPEYYATWELEGGGGSVSSFLELTKTSSQQITGTVADVTSWAAGTAISQESDKITYNATTGVFTLAANTKYKISADIDYTAASGAGRSTLDLLLTDSANTILDDGFEYIRDAGDKVTLSLSKRLVVGVSPLDIKLRHFISKDGGMTINSIKAKIDISI